MLFRSITDSGLKTSHGRLIFFAIKPTNLSVQPPEAVSNRIYALMTVLKGQAEIEMLALNSNCLLYTSLAEIVVKYLDGDPGSLDYDEEWAAEDNKMCIRDSSWTISLG